ncbi:MAG: DUF975 family protein [Eubacteriales bacterium]|nr:DUF975 family protein [Eubacteriales bacterium]
MESNWDRQELKWRAKDSVRRNYWAAVIVSLILVILASSASDASRGAFDRATGDYNYQVDGFRVGSEITNQIGGMWRNISASPWTWFIALFGIGILIVVLFLALFFQFFVGNVLIVGGKAFYIENLYSAPGVGKILAPFRSGHYWNVVKVMFVRQLFIFLWSLLFVIPGIIKAYEYYMVPYLLAEYPDMPREEAFARSKEMMYGEKWNAFVLSLSFIPWWILSSITFNIVGVFYVNPYVDATYAELYDTLAGNMNKNGNCSEP